MFLQPRIDYVCRVSALEVVPHLDAFRPTDVSVSTEFGGTNDSMSPLPYLVEKVKDASVDAQLCGGYEALGAFIDGNKFAQSALHDLLKRVYLAARQKGVEALAHHIDGLVNHV